MIQEAALQVLSTAINQYIKLDPQMPQRIAKLDGKVIALEFKGLPIKIFLCIEKDSIQFKSEQSGCVDTTLRAYPTTFMQMGLTSGMNSQAFSEDNMEIEGDVELGQDIKTLLDSIDIDWEEHLSQVVGDVAAHQAGNLVRNIKSWGNSSAETMRLNISEYVQEEVRYFPPRLEVEDFFQDIDTVRNDAERLSARLERVLTK